MKITLEYNLNEMCPIIILILEGTLSNTTKTSQEKLANIEKKNSKFSTLIPKKEIKGGKQQIMKILSSKKKK